MTHIIRFEVQFDLFVGGLVLKDEPRFEVWFSEGSGSLRFGIFRFEPTLIL